MAEVIRRDPTYRAREEAFRLRNLKPSPAAPAGDAAGTQQLPGPIADILNRPPKPPGNAGEMKDRGDQKEGRGDR